ncbi:MAG: glycosyltransferase family 4 protein [Gammaproteobacteria bacterium]
MKKVVCFFINNISRSGGTERVTSIIANQLVNSGYEVSIVSLFSDNDRAFFDLNDNIRVYTILRKPIRGVFGFPLVLLKLRALVARLRVDVLINVDSILALYTIPVCATSKSAVRNICWEHFNYHVSLGKKARSMARSLAAKYCDDIVTLTERDKALWIDNSRRIRNIVAINNPAPASNAVPGIVKVNRKTMLAVGRLTYQKGFDLLIQAFSHVVKQRRDWRLVIVGDGEDRAALGQLVGDLALDDCVELAPATAQINQYYLDASLFVMSSRFEGLPMVLLEAASFGLPIVSFDCDTGPSEVLTTEFGWLCESVGVTSLAHGILQAFEACDDPVRYAKMSSSAAAASARFSVDMVAPRWLELLSK